MSNETMLAARIHEYGGPEKLVIEEVARPQPKANEVLVRLHAAGVNHYDRFIRSGVAKQFMPITFPWILGIEGAGVIETLGAEVTTLRPGQAVFGSIKNSYAEYAVAPAAEVFAKPIHLSFEEAASVSIGALSAWGVVIEQANVQPGQHVLVQGGAGGVGSYAVQFARWKGARVTATTSRANVEYVRALGAETVIDYQTTKFEDVVRDVDAVIDTVGGEMSERSQQVLKPNGIFVTIAKPGARAADVARLKDIAALLESQTIIPTVGKIFPLGEAGQAHELIQTGHGRGRIVLLTK